PIEFAHPTGSWVAQHARNLVMDVAGRPKPLHLQLHDRDEGPLCVLFGPVPETRIAGTRESRRTAVGVGSGYGAAHASRGPDPSGVPLVHRPVAVAPCRGARLRPRLDLRSPGLAFTPRLSVV